MSRRRIRVILDVDNIDYGRLKRNISRNLHGIQKFGVNAGLSALDSMETKDANKFLVSLGNTFNGKVLDGVNQEVSEFGVRFSNISFRMDD